MVIRRLPPVRPGGSFRRIALATASLLALTAGGVISGAYWAASESDRIAREGDARVLAHMVRERANAIGATLDAVAIDDDAALGFSEPRTLEPAFRRLSLRMLERAPTARVMVSAHGRTMDTDRGAGTDREALQAAVAALIPELRANRRMTPGENTQGHVGGEAFVTATSDHREALYRRETHVATLPDGPAIVSAARVVPDSAEGLRRWRGDWATVVVAVPFSAIDLSAVGEAARRPDLHLVRDGPVDDHLTTLAVMADDGTVAAVLAWTPDRPGTRQFGTVLISIGAGGAVLAVITVGLLRRLQRTDRERALERERLSDFAAVGADWHWETDADGRFTYHSAPAIGPDDGPVSRIGRRRRELPHHPDDGPILDALDETLKRGVPFSGIEYRVADRGGRWTMMRIAGRPIHDRNGRVVGWRGTATDVQSEHLERAARRFTDEMLRDFAESASDWFWQTDESHRFVDFSHALEAFTAIRVTTMLGRTRAEFDLHPDDVAHVAAHMRDLDAHRPFRDLVYRVRNDQGGYTVISASGKPLFDPSGRFLGYRGSGRNVTDEYERRRELDERREALAQALSFARMGYLRRARDSERMELSPELFDILKLPPTADGTYCRHEMRARYVDVGADFLAGVDRLWSGGDPLQAFARFRRGDDAIIDIELFSTGEIGRDGTVVAVRGFIRDVTEQRRVEREIDEQRKLAERAMRAGGVGHWHRAGQNVRELWVSPQLATLLKLERSPDGMMPLKDFVSRYRDITEIEVARIADDCWSTGAERRFRAGFIRGDGQRVEVEVNGMAERDETGRIVGMHGLIRDVTEEVRVQRALEASRATLAARTELLSRTMRLSRTGYWRATDFNAATLVCSEELCELWGLTYRPEGIPFEEIRVCDVAAGTTVVREAYERAWREGLADVVTSPFVRPDGRLIYIRTEMRVETDAAGRVVAATGVVRDVTEEFVSARDLERSRAELATAAASLERAERLALLGSWRHEIGGGRTTWSEPLYDLLGVDRTAGPLDPRVLMGRINGGDRGAVAATLNAMLHQPTCAIEGWYDHPTLGERYIRIISETEFVDGRPAVVFGTAQDITATKRAEVEVTERREALAEAQSLGRIGDWRYRLGSDVVEWSPAVHDLLGYDTTSFTTSLEAVRAVHLGDSWQRLLEAQSEVIRTRGVRSIDVQLARSDGSVCDGIITVKANVGRDGRIDGFFGTVQDISERKRSERELEQLAYYDPLTLLANRALFRRAVDRSIATCAEQERTAALLLLDLDRFKEVNDSLGHAAGDELLRCIAEELRALMGPSAFIARLGGDEFAIILSDVDRAEALAHSQRIISALSRSFTLRQGEALIGTSVGIAMIPIDGDEAETLLRNADLALYEAKDDGRGRAVAYEPDLSEDLQEKTRLAIDLRRAIEADSGLEIRFQPQVDLRTGRVIGFETLCRWLHPVRGYVPPSEFIPIAESASLMVDLGLWVLRTACRAAAQFVAAGHRPRTISVNVSALQLWQGTFEDDVAAVLAETGLDPTLLELEVTESVFVKEGEGRVRRALDALRGLGVRLALDDFGTGYSSLGYLNELPFDVLKIDRIFVDGIETDMEKRKLLAGIVALGRGLGMTTVAEGAERSGEVDILRDVGCDAVQGFVYSRPVTVAETIAVADAIEAMAARRAAA